MKIIWYLFAVALFAIVSPVAGASCTSQQRADLAKSGYGSADIERMCAAADSSSGNAMDFFAKAFSARQSGDLRTAQQLFEQGLRIEPGNADARKYLSEVQESLSSAQKLFASAYSAKQAGDLTTAQQMFEQGLRIDPGNSMGQKFLAEVKGALASAPVQRSPKETCTDRPNPISRAICERRECEKPFNAKNPYCEQYTRPAPQSNY